MTATPAPRPTLGALVAAEVRKLASRASVRLSLAVLLAIAIGVPLLMLLASHMITMPEPGAAPAPAQPGQPQVLVSPPNAFEAGTALSIVLWLRNFFVFRALLIAVVAVAFAGEFVARTLREDLVRPVSRTSVLLAKWLALQVFVLAGAVVPLVVALPLALVLFGVTGDVAGAAQGFGLTWLGDAGFATLAMAVSVLLRSVPGTIGGIFLYWVIDRALGWLLRALEWGRDFFVQIFTAWKAPDLIVWLDRLIAARLWLPSYGFDVFSEFAPGDPQAWRPFAVLALYTALALALAITVFRRVDVD
jgi:ABC-type transport system involved in multi-copper enzyme maturation permease subunit